MELDTSDLPATKSSKREMRTGRMARTRILLATDSPWVVEDVSSELESDEYEMEVVDSGREAVRSVIEGKVGVLLVDMQIGSMGAPAVVAEVRNELDDKVASTPILCLLDRPADSWICKKMGADEAIVKPFEPGSLERAVRRLIRRKANSAATASITAPRTS
ncbi:MAG: hypothetical protein C4317_08685 [Acidimicrobiia bacterium]